jgi:5'-nucleotidase
VAPADERSGSSDETTPGGASYHQATTPGGNAGYAVDGFPADAVGVALDGLALEPHLFVSGINPGQNFGTFAPLSGTVGVGRTAIRRGVPALAVSGGFDIDPAQFEFGADLAADWIEANCADLIAGTFQTDTLASINIPTCTPEQMGPLTEVPRALEMPELPEGQDLFVSTCDLADPAPANDVVAVRSGYPAITQVEADI